LIGRFDEAHDAYGRALTQILHQDRTSKARLHRKIGNILVGQYRLAEAGQAYDQADKEVDVAQPETDAIGWQEWIQIQLDRIWLCYLQGKPEEILRLDGQARAAVDKFGTPEQRSKLFESLVLVALRRERYTISAETLAYAEAGLAAAKENDSLSVLARAQCVLGFVLLWQGDLARAENYLQSGQSLCEHIGDVSQQAVTLTYLSVLYRKRGQIDESLRYAQRAMAIATEAQMVVYIAAAKAQLAWVAWRAGNFVESQTQGRAALDLWQKSLVPIQWTALWPLLATSLSSGQVQEAVQYAGALLAPIQQRLPDDLTETLESALLESERGDPESARALLNCAVSQAQETGYL
jgi:tetratricopeptide (TPR) repeat protein